MPNRKKERISRILTELGCEVGEDPFEWGLPFDVVVIRKAVLALDDHLHATYMTTGGTIRDKTKKRREQESAVYYVLCSILTHHILFGMTEHAVHTQLKRTIETVDRKIAGEVNS
jgi:hypothetical protein